MNALSYVKQTQPAAYPTWLCFGLITMTGVQSSPFVTYLSILRVMMLRFLREATPTRHISLPNFLHQTSADHRWPQDEGGNMPSEYTRLEVSSSGHNHSQGHSLFLLQQCLRSDQATCEIKLLKRLVCGEHDSATSCTVVSSLMVELHGRRTFLPIRDSLVYLACDICQASLYAPYHLSRLPLPELPPSNISQPKDRGYSRTRALKRPCPMHETQGFPKQAQPQSTALFLSRDTNACKTV
jgi:hypothetical protein